MLSLLLLAATVWTFAHLPLGISDRNSNSGRYCSVYTLQYRV